MKTSVCRDKTRGQQSSDSGHKKGWPSANGRGPSKINLSNGHPSNPIHKTESKPALKEQTTPKSELEEPQKTEPIVSQHKVKKQLWLLVQLGPQLHCLWRCNVYFFNNKGNRRQNEDSLPLARLF